MPDVERARRLVEQEQTRSLRDRARDHGPLALTTRERRQVPRGESGQVEPVEHVGHDREILGSLAPEGGEVRRAAEQHVVGDGHERRGDRQLRHERDPACTLAA